MVNTRRQSSTTKMAGEKRRRDTADDLGIDKTQRMVLKEKRDKSGFKAMVFKPVSVPRLKFLEDDEGDGENKSEGAGA